ncbi:glycosyltransferase family 4 protein [Sporanaerobacter sp. PP17-6a]|uniref:glycosyltransferase family 4 protein n=1 Tax=Sporanaerobacter sp. PP17-6a TaxID=1891289 RepID=UPI00089FAF3B|nr:glycosyltransferase family 4 protein [Sporanaerobacter sp. PP17-6a]SCL85388.1 N, N'-diacetylbacillosaminyl-diphospho-undecaprenol alpha-1,3-N-acetylgalactosaminyltransferase [Sporanaerobacter sp. PP17-6a]
MKRILILANNAGGLYQFRFELIEKLIENNFEVYFSVPELEDNKEVKLIINTGANYIQTYIDRRGKNPFEDLRIIKNYKKIFKRLNPDLILTYTIKPNIYGSYVANKFNIPVIMNVTGIGSSLATGKFKGIIEHMYKYACNKANTVFFQNQSNRDFFIRNKIINENKTRTILIPGSGVNINKFKPVGKTKKDDITRFLFIGRIMKEKGIEEYLHVAESVATQYPNVEFQILGSFEEEKYKNLILNNKNEKLKYLGVSDDVRNEIREVDCIVHPSYHEGMSNVLLEGAAMGKPLIASNIHGCREIIDDRINGYLFKVKSVESLEEKIIDFIKLGSNMKKIMEEKSREKIENEFDRNIVIEKYMEVINNILKEGRVSESV